SCEPDYYDVAQTGTCVIIRDHQTHFDRARFLCGTKQSDLVKVVDSKMNSMLAILMNIRSNEARKQFPNDYYIGLRWLQTVKEFRWLNETTEAGYIHSSLKGPELTQKRCVRVKHKNGVVLKWYAGDCTTHLPYVCEKPAKHGSAMCPKEWLPSSPSGTCIKFYHFQKTWKGARAECRSVGADLVTIADHAMNSFIWEQVAFHEKTTYWFGLNDLKKNDVLRYLDTVDEVVYTQWDLDEPKKTPASDCGIIINKYTTSGDSKAMSWRTAPCTETHKFICEKFSDCQNKYNGMVCPVNCNTTNCLSKICNIRNGTCNLGCEPGYQGLACRAPIQKNENSKDTSRNSGLSAASIGVGLVLLGLCLAFVVLGLILRNRKIKEDKPEPAEPIAVETLKSASESSDNPSSPNSPSTGTSSDADSSEAENS
ncbi:hypothetical protein RRG08_005832, partial [Elysia crispata]